MSGIFAPKAQAAPPPPTPTPPPPLPDLNGPQTMAARTRAQQDMTQAGRMSTILSAPRRSGGNDYSGKQLG